MDDDYSNTRLKTVGKCVMPGFFKITNGKNSILSIYPWNYQSWSYILRIKFKSSRKISVTAYTHNRIVKSIIEFT